jgi:hypothetical protein
MKQYWRTPPDLYVRLSEKYGPFDFDPCPCPRPDDYDSLSLPWLHNNFVNPPFRKRDGVNGKGPTAFVRKAIEEQSKGKSSTLIIPVQSYVNLLLEAGAELTSVGRVRWLDATSLEPCRNPSPICCFHLKGK